MCEELVLLSFIGKHQPTFVLPKYYTLNPKLVFLDRIDEFTMMCEEVVLLSFVDKHHPTFGTCWGFLHLEKQNKNGITNYTRSRMMDRCRFLSMMDDMLGLSPMHIKYVTYVYDRLCI